MLSDMPINNLDRFTGSPMDRKQLKEKYGNDFKKYCQAYRPDDEDFVFFQETGMESFVRLESRLIQQARVQPYRASGQALLESFGVAAANEPFPAGPNVLFVSIDFEGRLHHKGINEFGLATFDVSSFLSGSGAPIETTNFALVRHRHRKYMFGETVRLHLDLLPKTIIEGLNRLSREDSSREIVLVCHGLQNELAILDDLGVFLEICLSPA